jgi:hypothetical protein
MVRKKTFTLLALLTLSLSTLSAAILVSGDLNFGNVTVGSSAERMMTIANTGEGPLTVSSISFPAGFSGNWTAGEIPASGTQTVAVTFSPVAAIAYGGTVIVNSDEPIGVNALPASGTGASGTSNDNFADRFTLSGMEAFAQGSSSGASKEPGEPNHAGNPGGASVWWSWTAPETDHVRISTAGSNFDTLLAVYTGTGIGNLTLIAENDDFGGVTSAVGFLAVAGTTYHIAVDGYGGVSGDVQLTIAPVPPVPPTFNPLRATYTGLFFPANAALTHENSGFFTVSTTVRGTYSGQLLAGGKRYRFSGRLEPDGSWTSQLNGDRTTFVARGNPAPQAGKYTIVFPGSDNPAVAPGGDGFGTIVVAPSGQVRFRGSLADGTKVSQSAPLSASGDWPFYVPLYSGNGSAIGWLTFADGTNEDISGLVDWFKPAQPRAKLYRSGFVMQTPATGSAYQFSRGMSVLDLSEGELRLEGGNLSEPLVIPVQLDARNTITDPNDRRTRVSITTSTGLLKGRVANPETGRPVAVNGVVLQKRGIAAGYFPGVDQSGWVYVGP